MRWEDRSRLLLVVQLLIRRSLSGKGSKKKQKSDQEKIVSSARSSLCYDALQ